MKRISFNILFAFAFIIALGWMTNVSAADSKLKFPKNKGAFSIKTEGKSYPVFIDGKEVGVSGADQPAIFFLDPGVHTVELRGPNGMTWVKDVNIVKYVQECICLKILETTTPRPCPYDIRLDAPSSVQEGDLVTFATWNAVRQPRNTDSSTSTTTDNSSMNKSVFGGKVINRDSGSAIIPSTAAGVMATAAALNYAWKVSPSNARITSGLGTNSITVDTTGLGGQTIVAELEVTDGMFDATCRQRVVAETKIPKIEEKIITPIRCDEFISRSFDDDKARFDNCVISLQNAPGSQLYIFVYQGTGKNAPKADRLVRRTLDYLVKSRGVPPQSIQIVQAGSSNLTGYEMWIVPPGVRELPTPITNKSF
ncbi:MAG: hypothetical protein MUC29_07940 [Pyrinomonadaceae bacterium]|nr:hypothetical protein [Pyrinomonadaceae bacterium]